MFTGPCVIYLQDAHKHTACPETLFCSRCQTKTISTRPLHPADSRSRVWFWLWESISPPLVAEWVEGKAILSFCLASLMSGADPVRSSPAPSLSQRGAGPAPAQWTTINASKQDMSLQDFCLHLEKGDVRTHWPHSAPFHASPLSAGGQGLCLSNSCTLQQGGLKGRMRPPCINDAKAGLHTHTRSWWSASNSCLHWATPEYLIPCSGAWWAPEEGWKQAEYPYILQQELLSCWGQALISAKGKHFSKERQGTRYHAKLSGQTLSGATQEDTPLRPPENMPPPFTIA